VKPTENDECVNVSVAKTDVVGFSIERGSGTVITVGIKENEGDRIWLIVLNEKWVNSKKKKMSRGIGSSEGTAQNENRRRAT
jgi:hypothetical protein